MSMVKIDLSGRFRGESCMPQASPRLVPQARLSSKALAQRATAGFIFTVKGNATIDTLEISIIAVSVNDLRVRSPTSATFLHQPRKVPAVIIRSSLEHVGDLALCYDLSRHRRQCG